jgi:hypothetical protein
MWGLDVPQSADPIELESPSADYSFDRPAVDKADYEAALYSYALGSRLFHDARLEFVQHMDRYKSNASVYFVHVDDCLSGEQLMRGDHDYLAAAAAKGPARRKLLESAATAYRNAKLRFAVTVLKYYIDEPVAMLTYPKDPRTGQPYNRATIESADPSTYLPTLDAALDATTHYLIDPVTHQYQRARDDYHDDRETYRMYLDRCDSRLHAIQQALQSANAP